MAGLTAASKYNVALVGAAIVVAHLQKEGWRLQKITYLAAAAAAGITSMIIASPYLLLDMTFATKGIISIMTAYSSGHPGYSGNASLFNTAWLLHVTGATGIVLIGLIFGERGRLLIPTLVFVVLFFVLLSSQAIRFERNLMPIIPAFLVMAVVGCFGLSQLFMQRLGMESKAAVALAAGGAILCYYLPLARTWNELVGYERDPRRSARLWLAQTVPLTKTLVIESYVPYVRETRRKLDRDSLLLRRDIAWVSSHDYAVISRDGSGRFLREEYPKQVRAFDRLSEIACEKYEFPVGSSQPDYIVFRFSCN
jgi:hypothetical protein